MVKPEEIENIEEIRRCVGIDDVELRQAIRSLRIGNHVKLTLLSGVPDSAGETLLVRITRIRGSEYRGKLVAAPVSRNLAGVRVGSRIAFTAAHIHSLAKRSP